MKEELNLNFSNKDLSLLSNDYQNNYLKILNLSIEHFYSSLNSYNDLKNNYSFNFFVNNIAISYTVIFQLFLKENKISYFKDNNNSYNLIKLFREIENNVKDNKIKINFLIPVGMKENLNLLWKLRNIFEHKPITEEIIDIFKYDSFIKNKYIGNSYFLVKKYLYLLRKFFNINLNINIFPLTDINNFNNEKNLYKLKNNSLLNEIDDYIESLSDDIKFNILNINNFNNKKGFRWLPDINNDKNWCKSYQFLNMFWKINPEYKLEKKLIKRKILLLDLDQKFINF